MHPHTKIQFYYIPMWNRKFRCQEQNRLSLSTKLNRHIESNFTHPPQRQQLTIPSNCLSAFERSYIFSIERVIQLEFDLMSMYPNEGRQKEKKSDREWEHGSRQMQVSSRTHVVAHTHTHSAYTTCVLCVRTIISEWIGILFDTQCRNLVVIDISGTRTVAARSVSSI